MTDNNPDVRKPLILIAEDVESNYKLLEIILKKEYDLLWAKNGREAVDFAMEHKPDAILMDIKMPVMDGIEALKEIRRYTAELPVIMQTAYAFDTDRRTADAFLQLYEAHGVNVTLRTVGTGTAVQETLSTLGLEKTEKAVLLAVVTAQTWQEVQRDLRRKMRIDVPGTGIAFTVPLSSIGGKRALGFLTEHQTLTWKEESTLKDTRYELLLVIANQGYTGSIMDAARAAGAGGGTVIHAKGTGMEGAAPFLGMELVNEKELVLIVSRTAQKNRIMKAIMDGADRRAGAIVFSLPVTDTAGLRLLEEEEPATK